MTVEAGLAFTAAAAMGVAALCTLIWYRPRHAESAVVRWETQVGLPSNEALRAAAVRRRVRRVTVGSAGVLLGLLAGSTALVVDQGILGVTGCALGASAGYVLACCTVDVEDLRALVVRREKLRDSLTRLELTAQYVALVMPAAALVLGVASAAPEAMLRVVLAGVSRAVCSVILAYQWRMLGRPSPAGSEVARRWDDARRVQILHELCQSEVFIAYLVFWSATSAIPPDAPAWIDYAASPARAAALFLMMFTIVSGQRAMRRAPAVSGLS